MIDEGYLKFVAHWNHSAALPESVLSELGQWRQRLFGVRLIGVYPSGIGYGNLSCRWGNTDQFVITGSATGGLPALGAQHYVLVSRTDPDRNQVWCDGPIVASSESMSHAVIYRECPWVNAVMHVHSRALWERLLHRVPTTDRRASYGTPEMARSIVNLLENTDLAERRIFVMEGHEEGVFTFGRDLDEAGELLLAECQAALDVP